MGCSSTRPSITGILNFLTTHPSPSPSWLIVFNRNVTYTSQSTVVPIMSGDWFPILSQSFTINQPLNYQTINQTISVTNDFSLSHFQTPATCQVSLTTPSPPEEDWKLLSAHSYFCPAAVGITWPLRWIHGPSKRQRPEGENSVKSRNPGKLY